MSTRSSLKPVFRWDRTFSKTLLTIGLPMVIQNLVSSILNIIDNVMVGSLGEAAHAGVSQALSYTFLFNIFLFGIGSGASIYFAQYWGRKETGNIHRVMRLAFCITIPLALVFILAFQLFSDQIVGLFIHDPLSGSFAQCKLYLRWAVLGFMLQAIDVVYASVLKATNKPQIPMVAGMVSIITNVALNYVLIFGHFGFPALGVQGAAIATIASSGASLLINTTLSYRRRLPSAFTLRQKFPVIPGYTKQFLKTVSPVILNEGLWALGMVTYTMFYGTMGEASMSAMGIYKSVEQLTFVTIYGLMGACSIIVGQALGTGDKEKAYLYAQRMLFASVALGIVMGLILIPLRFPIVSLFGISDGAREKALQVILFSAFFAWLRSFNSINVVGILRSGGDTLFSLILDTGTVWGIGVPCVWITSMIFKWPIEYVFLFTHLEGIVKALIGLPRMTSKKWINELN